jgi:hypothetical protein
MPDQFEFDTGGTARPTEPGETGDSTSGADEDVIDTGERRRPQPLARAGALLAVVAAIAALVLHARSGGHPSPRAEAQRPIRAPASAAAPRARAPASLGAPVSAGLRDATDVGIGADVLYAVHYGTLTALDIDSGAVVAMVHVPELANYDTAPYFRVVPDLAVGRIWLIREGDTRPSTAIEFDAESLRRLGTVHLPDTVQASAVLDGRVYLATADGVRVLKPGARVAGTAPGLSGFVGTVAADPRSDRLVILNDGFPTEVVSEHPDGRGRVAVRLPFGGGQVAIVRGAAWVGGWGVIGARIVHLSVPTLARLGAAPVLAGLLGPGAEFVGTGSRSVWVRSAASANELWCMDATTGAIGQFFADLPGPVTSTSGFAPVTSQLAIAYAAPQGVVRPVRLGGCPG